MIRASVFIIGSYIAAFFGVRQVAAAFVTVIVDIPKAAASCRTP